MFSMYFNGRDCGAIPLRQAYFTTRKYEKITQYVSWIKCGTKTECVMKISNYESTLGIFIDMLKKTTAFFRI